MKYYDSFIKYWLDIYKEQAKKGMLGPLKRNIYLNWNLTTQQKDKIWEMVMGD